MGKQTKNLTQSPLYEEKFGAKESGVAIVLYWIVVISAFVVLLFSVYWTARFDGVVVSGNSMRNTLYDGEQLLMQKTDGSDAERGDVIVVYVGDYAEFDEGNSTGEKTQFLIKRLIAVEGDRVRCTDGTVEICYAGTDVWETIDEPYAYYTDKTSYDFAEYTVGEGEVFFLGDNRNNSMDSRYQENFSRLDRLYKRSDIYGIVPKWAIEHQSALEKIFFFSSSVKTKLRLVGCFGAS